MFSKYFFGTTRLEARVYLPVLAGLLTCACLFGTVKLVAGSKRLAGSPADWLGI